MFILVKWGPRLNKSYTDEIFIAENNATLN